MEHKLIKTPNYVGYTCEGCNTIYVLCSKEEAEKKCKEKQSKDKGEPNAKR